MTHDLPRLACAADVLAIVGTRLGPTGWVPVTQEMIDAFGRTTGDTQWLHVDPERAANGPFGACVAHGLLTLSLAGGRFFHELLHVSARSSVNYGSDRVRYPAPLLAGSRVRGLADVPSAKMVDDATVQVDVRVTVEVENGSRPACVADFIVRYAF